MTIPRGGALKMGLQSIILICPTHKRKDHQNIAYPWSNCACVQISLKKWKGQPEIDVVMQQINNGLYLYSTLEAHHWVWEHSETHLVYAITYTIVLFPSSTTPCWRQGYVALLVGHHIHQVAYLWTEKLSVVVFEILKVLQKYNNTFFTSSKICRARKAFSEASSQVSSACTF